MSVCTSEAANIDGVCINGVCMVKAVNVARKLCALPAQAPAQAAEAEFVRLVTELEFREVENEVLSLLVLYP